MPTETDTPYPNLDMVWVKGTYKMRDQFRTPAQGVVIFESTIITVDAAAEEIYIPVNIPAPLDSQGHFRIQIPASDDSDTTPTVIPYTVRENIIGGSGRSPYLLHANIDLVEIDLAIYGPTGQPPDNLDDPPEFKFVTVETLQAMRGSPGGLATLGADGKLLEAQRPAGSSGESTTYEVATPASTWVVPHGLGRYPIVDVIVGGEKVLTDVHHTSEDSLSVVFSQPTAGQIVLI